MGGDQWAFGWGRQKDDQSVAALRYASERGVNWIDTAAVYGLGHSEEIVGRALREIPETERPLVFSKCGMRWDEGDPLAPLQRVLRPESIRFECEASLRRLGIEAIDLYQFHWPDETDTPVEDSWGEMARLVGEGKVRHAGVSNFDVALLERCEPIMHVDSLQPPFSLIKREAAQDLIPWCLEHGTGVICYSPMQAGILTDAFTTERVTAMADTDWRRGDVNFVSPAIGRNIALRDALRPIADRHATTVSAIAVAWVIAWPGVTGAIIGARSPEQVNGSLPAANVLLTAEDLGEISAAIRMSGAGAGPASSIGGLEIHGG